MLTPTERLDLSVAVTDYRQALLSGDNDRIADTSEVLDCVMGAMDTETNAPDIDALLVPTIADEMDLDEAAAALAAALDALAPKPGDAPAETDRGR